MQLISNGSPQLLEDLQVKGKLGCLSRRTPSLKFKGLRGLIPSIAEPRPSSHHTLLSYQTPFFSVLPPGFQAFVHAVPCLEHSSFSFPGHGTGLIALYHLL